jgi:hypothetical protein
MDNFIRVVEDAVPLFLCQALRDALTENKGQTSEHVVERLRCYTIMSLPVPGFPETEALVNMLVAALRPHIEGYRRDFGVGALCYCGSIEPPQLIRYVVNEDVPERFWLHSDTWSPGSAPRQIAIKLYLNDVEKGGALNFPELGVSIQPKAGRLLLHPASFTHMHEATPPTSGPKDVCVTWLHLSGDPAPYATIAYQ